MPKNHLRFRPTIDIDAKAELSRKESNTLYLVGSEECSVPRAVEIWSQGISTENKLSIWAEHCTENDQNMNETASNFASWQRSASRHKTCQRNVRNTSLGSATSPDCASSDYHLFWSMAHALAEDHFNSYENIEKWISEWIFSKDESFFRRGIRLLLEKWKIVIDNNGQYFD